MRTLTGVILVFLFSLSTFSQNAKKFYKTGEEFFKAGNYQDAINQFTSAVSLNPQYKDAYFMRGSSYEITKDFTKAAESAGINTWFHPFMRVLNQSPQFTVS